MFAVWGVELSTTYLFYHIHFIVMQDCPLLLMHLSYYVIAFHLKHLYLPAKNANAIPIKMKNETSNRALRFENLEESIQIFDMISQATSELNHTFSIPSLIFLVLKFVSSISNTFSSIFGILNSNAALNKSTLASIFATLMDWCKIFLILSSAEMPINEVINSLISLI